MLDLSEAIPRDLEYRCGDMPPHPNMPSMDQLVFDIVPLVYNDSIDTSVITNVLLIDNSVQEYQQFVDGCNTTTFPVVYDYHSDRSELKELLSRKFSNIQRIAFVFHNAGMNGKLFLNNQCFFDETPFSENFQVLVDIIRDFGVGHVDYLACNSLQYDNWKQYYELLQTTANVVIGASNDATGNVKYGGDWVMENTSQDIKTMYFNDNIDKYTKTLATSVISASITLTDASLNDSNVYTWPITINGGTASSPVVITFGDNITLNDYYKYFIIGSDYVTIDGNNKTVTISGVTNYLGLIQNGTGNTSSGIVAAEGKSNITVQNIKISSSNSTLSYHSGWICQAFYGNSSSGMNLIQNCTNNNGNISYFGGGITGGFTFAFSTGTNTVSNCKNMGVHDSYYCGGIAGSYFARSSQEGSINTISNCTNSGNMAYNYCGGIVSGFCFQGAYGTNTIINCSNNVNIPGANSGGIVAEYFALNALAGSTITIMNCINIGTVSNAGYSGIAASSFAQNAPLSTIRIKNCYTLYGIIGPSSQYLSNTYEANGTWSTINALQKLLLEENNTYIWAYPKVNGVDQPNSPFLLYSLNPNNTPYKNLVEWTLRTSAADNNWTSVTYGNGLYVAVSNSGTNNRVMTSPDGITWTSRTSAANNNYWTSVTYGNGLYVAVSNTGTDNRVMTSPDGIIWTSRTSAANNNWTSVTYGNGLYVAVSNSGTNNRVMTSPDGITWTSRTSVADNSWTSLTYGNGLYVAVSNSGTNNRVMTSPDGITWTLRTSVADNSWTSLTYGNGLYVAVSNSGTNNRVMTSPDGITWTSRTSAANNNWTSVTYGNGLYVAVSNTGTNNRVMTSPDGITWTSRRSAADNSWTSVTYGNGLYVAVSNTGTNNRVMWRKFVIATEMRQAGYTAIQLNSVGYTATELKTAGYTIAELKTAGYVIGMREAQYTIAEMKEVGYIATEMKEAGYTAIEMRQAEYTIAELKTAGYTATEMRQAGYTIDEMKEAGYTATEMKEAGYTATEMKAAEYTITELKTAGYVIGMREAQYTATEMRQVGYTATEMKAAGYTATQVKAAGYTASEMHKINVLFYYRDTFGDGWNSGSITISNSITNQSSITLTGPASGPKNWQYTNGELYGAIPYKTTKVNGSYPSEILYAITLNNKLEFNGTTAVITANTNILVPENTNTLSFNIPNSYYYTATEMREAEYTIAEMKAAGYVIGMREAQYTATEMKALQYSIAELKTAGYTATEMRQAEYTITELKTAGYVIGMREAQYTATEMRQVGYTATEMKAAGYTATQVKAAGYTASEMHKINVLFYYRDTFGDGWNSGSITISNSITNQSSITLTGPASGPKNWQYTNGELYGAIPYKTTKVNGSYPSEILYAITLNNKLEFNGTTAVITANTNILVPENTNTLSFNIPNSYYYTATEMREAEYTIADMKAAGYFIGMREAQYTATEMRQVGYTATEMRQVGYTATEMKAEQYTIAELKTAGYTATEMKAAQYTIAELKTAGYTATEMRQAGYTATEMKAAQYTIAELKTAGYTATELKTAGYTATEMRQAGYTATEMKAAQYTIAELKTAGYTATELKTAGYTATEMKAAQYTIAELKTAGYTATEMKAAQYTIAELKTAGYTATEMYVAGYTITELKTAGYIFTEYYTSLNNNTNYTAGNNTYTAWTSVDDGFRTIVLTNPFNFNNTNYSTIYVNSNGLITFDAGTVTNSGLSNTQLGIFAFHVNMYTVGSSYIRYKELSDTFEVIYNNVYYSAGPSIQVKVTLKLNNNINPGDIIIDYGNIVNYNLTTVIAVGFNTKNSADALNVNFNSPNTFSFPVSPIQNITNTQSQFSNKQLVITPVPPNPPAITNILPNQITGTYVPNSSIVVTERTTNNQTITSQIQSNTQGTWYFNLTNPTNNYSFAPLNANQLVRTLTSSYSFRYPQSAYIFTVNTPVLTKPRQHGTNQLDQRSWRISPKLPPGLKFSGVTGIISGTPTEPASSTTYTVWSNSEVFLSYRRQLTIKIVTPP
jgi:ribosomal protein L13E